MSLWIYLYLNQKVNSWEHQSSTLNKTTAPSQLSMDLHSRLFTTWPQHSIPTHHPFWSHALLTATHFPQIHIALSCIYTSAPADNRCLEYLPFILSLTICTHQQLKQHLSCKVQIKFYSFHKVFSNNLVLDWTIPPSIVS